MNIIYSDQNIERCLNVERISVFLAGPTPRSKDVLSWRPLALEFLKNRNYYGQILVPEPSIPIENFDYDIQVEWEFYGLENCSTILFWVPRIMNTMPALTTNVEFGRYVNSGKVIYGRPDDAVRCKYLDWLYKKYNSKPIYNNLLDLINSLRY